MSLEELIHSNKDFKGLMLFISTLDSQNIPRELLVKYSTDTVIDELIYSLKKYSLITSDSSSPLGSIFSIHRSTQSIILAYFIQNLQLEQNKKILDPMATILEKYIESLLDKEDFTRLKAILSHCDTFLKHKNILNDEMQTNLEASLGAMVYHVSYDTKKISQMLENSIAKLRQSSKGNYALKARTMTFLADLYRKLGYYEKAENLLQESLVLYTSNSKRTLEEAYSLASFGLLYQTTSNYQKAKELLERSIAIYKTYPENKIGLARASAYLGLTYANLGNYHEAINFLEKSKEIYKNHPNSYYRLPWVLTYIGDIYRKIGDYEKAEQSLQESLAIHTTYGIQDNYIDRLRVSAYLGIVYGEIGNYKQAINYIDKSLQGYKEYYAKGFDRIWTMAHLAEIYRFLGNYTKAQILLEDCLVIHSDNIKTHSIDIREAWLLAKLGTIYNDLGNYMEAWKIITRSVNVYKELYGNNNIKTAKTLFRLAEVYKSLEQPLEAIKIFEECLTQYKKIYGDNHIKTANLMNSLASAHLMNNDFTKAEMWLNKALNIFKKSSHVSYYLPLESFGDLYKKMADRSAKKGDLEQSKVFMKQAADNFKKALEVLKTAIQEEESIHIVRIQKKLKETLEEN